MRHPSVWLGSTTSELQEALIEAGVRVEYHTIHCTATPEQKALHDSGVCKSASAKISCALHPKLLAPKKVQQQETSWGVDCSVRTQTLEQLFTTYRQLVVFWLLPQTATVVEKCFEEQMASACRVERFR